MCRRSIAVLTAEDNRSLVGATLLFCLSALFMLLLHPRLGIRDVDGYAYVVGARSIHQGTGYRSLTGEPFNHWPPGYSLLLSCFRNPIQAALILNYLSFGVAVGLLYYLLRRVGWTWQAGLGFSVTLASGFFRLLANSVHADILTYAMFLLSICMIIQSQARTLPALIWAVLVPIKLIAIVFLPSAFAANWITMQTDWKRLLPSYVPAAIATAMSVGGVMGFNFLTTKTWTGGQSSTSLAVLTSGARSFIVSVLRGFLFGWHGTVASPLPMIAFVVCMLLATIVSARYGQYQMVGGSEFMGHHA
jgi:hypothetical protein